MGIGSIPRRIRSLQRFPQILSVAVKFGFGDVLSRIGLESALHSLRVRLFPENRAELITIRPEERLRLALEDLGPTFIKLGQVLATRPDLIPMSLILELRKLQDKVKPFDTEGIKQHVEGELGRPLDEVFAEFDPQPLAAASIAQVHRAVLRDGRKVVLKIQRPNLERLIETDLSILGWLAALIEERSPELRRYRPCEIVEEFRKSLTKEIDFTIEAYHIKRFKRNFRDDPSVYVPEVIDELTTSRILCEEFIDGVKLNAPDLHQRTDIDLKAIARNGVRFILVQTFEHGFFHADPHPGNIFVLPTNRICPIDYGMMGVLDRERIDELLTFLVAILTKDVHKVIRLFRRGELIGEETDVRGLQRDILDLVERFEAVDLAKLDIGRYLQGVFEAIVRHDVRLPADLLLVGKALATIEGVARDIYPELNTLEEIRPIILRIYLQRLTDPGFHTRAPRQAAEDLLHLAETAPRDAQLTLQKLRRGELRLRLQLDEYEEGRRAQAQAVNRLALSIVMGSLFLGAVYLFTRADLTPWIGDFPLNAFLGAVGLVMAVVYGAALFVGFFRSGGL